jgi:hypothetical protein
LTLRRKTVPEPTSETTATGAAATNVPFSMIHDWIPVIQALLWPLFFAVLIIVFQKYLKEILESIRSRIESGDGFSAGTSGIKLEPTEGGKAAEGESQNGQPDVIPQFEKGQSRRMNLIDSKGVVPQAVSGIFLVHASKRDRSLDKGEYQYYRLKISVDAEVESDLDLIEKVVYHLHPTFKNPDREISDRESNFAFTTIAWGQFLLTAEIYLKGNSNPMVVDRYINF